jgi:FG-GAP repeat
MVSRSGWLGVAVMLQVSICLCGSVRETAAVAAAAKVRAEQKISTKKGNLGVLLEDNDMFGFAVAGLGDIDGDATQDLAVGAQGDDDGGPSHGAVYVLFLHPNGTVKAGQKISDTQGNFKSGLRDGDFFGCSVTSLGDIDGDSTQELVVGAMGDADGGGPFRGAVYVLFLHRNGTVKTEQKISSTRGDFAGPLGDGDRFGHAVAALNDFDGDGFSDLAVGAVYDRGSGAVRGALYVLFLRPDGRVKTEQKISDTQGNFAGFLDNFDDFGCAVTNLGDLDGDSTGDIAVGARNDDDGGSNRGAVYVLFLHPIGTVRAVQKISDTQGNLPGVLDDEDIFGLAVSGLGDVDGDATQDLAVGAHFDDDGGPNRGAVYVLFLHSNGTIKTHVKISDTRGNFGGVLVDGDSFGCAVSLLGDIDGDATQDLAAGTFADDDGGPNRGAVYVIFLAIAGGPQATTGGGSSVLSTGASPPPNTTRTGLITTGAPEIVAASSTLSS